MLAALVTVWVVIGQLGASGADKAGCTSPSWALPRLAGFGIESCADRNWAKLDISLPKGATPTVYGRRSIANFTLADQTNKYPYATVPISICFWSVSV